MRRYASITIIALLLAACGADVEKAVGTKSPVPAPSSSVTATATTSPAPSGNPLPSDAATPAQALPQRPCQPRTDFSPNAGVPGQNYIRAVTRPTRNWGRGCEVLSPGDRCEVQWDGSYILLVATEAHLTFQAWSKGQSKPFKELTAGPLPAEHRFRKVGFPVEIPRGATEVAFRIVLRDQTKTPIAISDAFAYRINCRPE